MTVRNLLASFRETSQPTAGPQCEALELRQLLAADLIGVSVDAEPPSAQPGEEVDVTLQYRNGGDESTSLFRVDVVLSKDATIGNSDDVRIGRFRRFRDIDPAQVVTSTRTFDLPEDMDPGAYFVGFRLDAGEDVDEGDETNNTVMSAKQLITVGGDDEADYEVLGRDDEVIADGDVSPSIFDGTGFGRVLVNNGTRTREFTIVNDDDTALDIQDIVITGANASDFQILDMPTDPILPGDSATFSIEFDPSRLGRRRATVTITPGSAGDDGYDFAISGRGRRGGGGTPDISVEGIAAIADGDRTPRLSDGTHFGKVGVDTFAEQDFTITNDGTGALQLTSPFVSISGRNADRFSIVSGPDDMSLDPGESTTFRVRFDPGRPGDKRAVVQIFTTDPDETTFDFLIRGIGQPAHA